MKTPHVVFHEDLSDPADEILRSQPPWVEEQAGGRHRRRNSGGERSPSAPMQNAAAGGGSDNEPRPVELEFIADWQVYAIVSETDPKTVKEALDGTHADQWRRAIVEEISQLLRNLSVCLDWWIQSVSTREVARLWNSRYMSLVSLFARPPSRGVSARPGLEGVTCLRFID